MAQEEKANLFTWTDVNNKQYSYTLQDIEQLKYKQQYIRDFLSKISLISTILKKLGVNLSPKKEPDEHQILKKLENTKFNLDAKDASGNTPLHLAAQEGNKERAINKG